MVMIVGYEVNNFLQRYYPYSCLVFYKFTMKISIILF